MSQFRNIYSDISFSPQVPLNLGKLRKDYNISK